ncbi:MAG TPA: hypothetical protein VLJ39_07460 [Tepidisphaeraceae bacterium]|nr:hypothetical protein [Tepidisphaeraceae bacterium]
MARIVGGRKLGGWVAGILAASAAGCGMKLETGYAYRPLNASTAQRRAYYASPYSPEKTAAQQENKSSPGMSFGH